MAKNSSGRLVSKKFKYFNAEALIEETGIAYNAPHENGENLMTSSNPQVTD